MGRWADIVTAVKTAVGDTTDATARGWVLEAARNLNAEAQFLTAPVTVGTTVADQAEYSLGDTLVDLAAVRVGTTVYDRASANDIWALEQGTLSLSGSGGVFAPAFTSTGSPKISLWPVPSEAGLAVEGREVIEIPAPADWATEDPPLPKDFDKAIRHGAIATGLALSSEQLQEAEWHEARYTEAARRLERRRNSRIGSGGVCIRLGNLGR
jgi:hypothetical protein